MGLTKEQAKLVSQYMVKEYVQNGTHPRMVEVWDYLVEVPGRDGQPVRLTIRVKGFGFDLPEPGHMVPVLVNRRRWVCGVTPTPRAIASVREATPSLPKMLLRWRLTVPTARISLAAIWLSERPSSTRRKTSSSRSDKRSI